MLFIYSAYCIHLSTVQKVFLKSNGIRSLESEIKNVFVYNFVSRRTKYSNLVPIPPEIDILDTPGLSSVRFGDILEEKSNMAVHSRRSSTAETQSAVIFDPSERETVPLDGYEDPQSNKYYIMTFQVEHIGQCSS